MSHIDSYVFDLQSLPLTKRRAEVMSMQVTLLLSSMNNQTVKLTWVTAFSSLFIHTVISLFLRSHKQQKKTFITIFSWLKSFLVNKTGNWTLWFIVFRCNVSRSLILYVYFAFYFDVFCVCWVFFYNFDFLKISVFFCLGREISPFWCLLQDNLMCLCCCNFHFFYAIFQHY